MSLQKRLPVGAIPNVCILDPDGDMVRHLLAAGRARRHPEWACYHTDLYVFEHAGLSYGIVGCVVGAAFAVLVAEELFVSGCKVLISMTSAGQIELLTRFLLVLRSIFKSRARLEAESWSCVTSWALGPFG